MAKVDPGTKQKALAIAEEAGAAEAERATGISAGTIRSWVHRLQRNSGVQRNTVATDATQRNTKKMEALKGEAVERAVEEAGDYIADRLKGMADDFYNLAQKATGKVDVAITDPEDLPEDKHPLSRDRDGAAWLRSLVGVMAQSVDKAQLLSGKPTARNEERRRHEYEFTQRIISDPDAVDLADQLLRRASGRDPGTLRMGGDRGTMDSIRPPTSPES